MSIEVEIRKKLGGFQLESSFTADNGVLALTGQSGSGKSLTLRCIAGIQTPDEGKIVVDGETWFDSSAKINLAPQRRRAGLMLQNYALFPNMTVLGNLMSGMGWEKDRAKRREAARRYLAQFGLEGLADHYPRSLSGGQQQRAALARMLASRPRILLLDEPFSALDPQLRWEVERETSRHIAAFGGVTLMVSHDRGEVYRASDHVAIYHGGRIECLAETKALFRRPETEAAARFTGCRNIAPAECDGGAARAARWGMTFALPGDAADCGCIGIPQDALVLAQEMGENTAHYRVRDCIEEEKSRLWCISVVDNAPDGLLYWETELPKEGLLRVPPEKVLYLRRSGT